MRPIPEKIKKQINKDPFYNVCCITGSTGVSIEHAQIYAGKQISDLWALVPLRRDLNTSHPPKEVKDKCKLISLERAKAMGEWDNIKKKYPKKDWDQEYNFLIKTYGKPKRSW